MHSPKILCYVVFIAAPYREFENVDSGDQWDPLGYYMLFGENCLASSIMAFKNNYIILVYQSSPYLAHFTILHFTIVHLTELNQCGYPKCIYIQPVIGVPPLPSH